MRRTVLRLVSTIVAASALTSPASAAATGATDAQWHVLPYVTATVVPNYQSGFGPQGGTGSGTTPAVGSSAMLGGGFVDFGTITAGYSYIYKYAAQVNIKTNDSSGFQVYGEGSTDFQGASTGTQPINSLLYWAVSSSANSPYTAATPFEKTTFTPGGGGTTISYGGSTPPVTALIWSSPSSGAQSHSYDYQMRLPSTIPTDTFTAYVVYTVIGN